MSKTRLQDEYNKAIRQCDLFVMLFYTKVGQYTEEEFETAFGQFKATNKPLIFTYFKDAEISTGSANKKDLMSLWAFEEKLGALGHFRSVYKNIDELKVKFDQQLNKLEAAQERKDVPLNKLEAAQERKGPPTPNLWRDRWLDLAPKPDTLPAGKDWHVFLSYRSVNRPWVLALYDVLNVLGYKTFLDQYALTAATPFAIALGDAMDASASAVMIWSGSYENSEWCKQEFAALETRQRQKKGFHYVIARIDESEIAGFAASKLWIDFSNQREGPAGSGLLSLLYALKGKPLPPEVVKLAAEVDSQMRDGLLSVKALRNAGDADALLALAEMDDMAWAGSPTLKCSVAEGLIAMNKTPEAIKVLDLVEAAFPKAMRPKQLRGLALARSGQTMKAQLLLGKLYAAGEIDPDTLGILAETWMDRYRQSGRHIYLLKSRDLYRQAFEAFPTDYYTGINAASKSLLAGDKETAAQLAARVQRVVGDKPVANDYRMTATAAELQLLQAKFPEAAALYRVAVLITPDDIASHESTHAQAKLLSQALGASDEQRALIDAAFG